MVPNRTTERGFLHAADGVRLFYETDEVEDAKAAVLMVHGFLEHSGRYQSVVERLSARGISCFRFDCRGHGQSGGARGHVYHFSDYLDDLALLRDELLVPRAGEDCPRFLLGHSNGGLIALHFAARENGGAFNGVCLSSPFFGFGLKVPWIKAAAGRALSRLLPALALPADVHPEWVSHDKDVVLRYRNDPLNIQIASGRWFTETLAAHEASPARASELRLPVLVQQAGDDKIASVEATRRVFEKIGSEDKRYEEYPRLFHEIWFELDRDLPLTDLETWMAERTPS